MAIPFVPPPPDEYSLRRLHELVEELYALIVSHLMNEAISSSEPQRRRGPSCTDDEKNNQLMKRDGGDSDSDPDACASSTAVSADSVFAEVVAELELVQNQGRCYPDEPVAPSKRMPEESNEEHPRPSGSGTPWSPRSCTCNCLPQPVASPGWETELNERGVANAHEADPGNSKRTEPTRATFGLGTNLSFFGTQPLGRTFWATIACFIGYRLFCFKN